MLCIAHQLLEVGAGLVKLAVLSGEHTHHVDDDAALRLVEQIGLRRELVSQPP